MSCLLTQLMSCLQTQQMSCLQTQQTSCLQTQQIWGYVKCTFGERFLRVWTSWKWTFLGTVLGGFDSWKRRAAATQSEPRHQNGKRSHMVQVTTKKHLGGGPF